MLLPAHKFYRNSRFRLTLSQRPPTTIQTSPDVPKIAQGRPDFRYILRFVCAYALFSVIF